MYKRTRSPTATLPLQQVRARQSCQRVVRRTAASFRRSALGFAVRMKRPAVFFERGAIPYISSNGDNPLGPGRRRYPKSTDARTRSQVLVADPAAFCKAVFSVRTILSARPFEAGEYGAMKRQVIRFLAAYSWVYPAVELPAVVAEDIARGTKRVHDAISNDLRHLLSAWQCGSDRPTGQVLHANEEVAIALGRQR